MSTMTGVARKRARGAFAIARQAVSRLAPALACLALVILALAGEARSQVVTGIAPNTGSTAGGTNVTITGGGLGGTTGVMIGGVPATNVVVVNGTTVTATTGARAAGTVDVVLTIGAEQATGVGLYTYATPAPTVTGVAPNTGTTAGGTVVTITGTNFTGATAVTFGGVAATGVVVNNATTITATTPANVPGLSNVSVTTPGGTGTGNGLYTYLEPQATVTAIAPNTGSTAGGTNVTITGNNFIGVTGVTVGGVPLANMLHLNINTITGTTGARAAGVVDVVVTTLANGTGTGAGLFTYVAPPPAPTVTAVAPNSGPATGGTVVTITGTNFSAPALVSFGGALAFGVTVNSPTSMTVTTSAGVEGVVDVTVTNEAGAGTGVGMFTYTGPQATVTAITPNTGGIAGGTPVTISGTNFTGVTGVTIGGAAVASFVVVNATTITAVTGPRAAATVNVVVTTEAGPATGASLFTYAATGGPTVANATLSVPFASPGTQINLGALVTGAFTTVAIATQPTRGAVTLNGAVATYIPNRTYSGPDSFTFTATGAGGTSQPGTISVTVGARPNPTNDPNVRAIIQNQILVSDRFASTQISNIATHLEGMHCDDNEPGNRCQEETVNLGGLSGSGGAPQGGAALAFADLQKPYQPSAFETLLKEKGFLSAFPQTRAQGRSPSNLPFSIWAAGSVQFGTKNWDGTPSNRFSTSGVTVGVDRRFAPGLRAGVAFGLGTDRVRIGQDGTRIEATALSASLYATWMIMPKTFLDAIAGYAGAGFDTRRYVPAGTQFVSGNRDGAVLFGSATLTREERFGALKIAPYLRFDVKHIMLNAYREGGSDIWALAYDKLETTRVSGTAGLRMSYPMMMSWGVLTPMLRLEYVNVFSGSYSQTLRYADQFGGPVYTLTGNTPGRNAFSAALGLKAVTEKNVTADLEYQFTGGSGVTSQTVRAAVRFGF